MTDLLNLPDETLVVICRHLHCRDLVSLSRSCKDLNRICGDDDLWRWQCEHYFIDNLCTEGLSWKQHFIKLFIDFGKYPDYKEFKTAWGKIRKFIQRNCPILFSAIQDGVSETVLDNLEETLQHKLPPDFRVSYRICDGQDLTRQVEGLLGGASIHNYMSTFKMNSIAGIKGTYQVRLPQQLNQDLFLLACHRDASIFYAYRDIEGFTTGSVYTLFNTQTIHGIKLTHDFFCLGTFKDWIVTYANKLDENAYYVKDEHIYRFYHEPSCHATTYGITVHPAVCFVPELSERVIYQEDYQASYFFAYRITLSMSEDTPKSLSSQLETRHWIITDGTGAEERVNGPGVVGEHPIMKPGETFSWISCCTFPTPTGNMKGHFRFRNLASGEINEVVCPCYHMEAAPVLTYEERQQLIEQRQLMEAESQEHT